MRRIAVADEGGPEKWFRDALVRYGPGISRRLGPDIDRDIHTDGVYHTIQRCKAGDTVYDRNELAASLHECADWLYGMALASEDDGDRYWSKRVKFWFSEFEKAAKAAGRAGR